jgi:hypothetical protein
MCQTIHLTRHSLPLHRLGYCCRAWLVDDVVVKVKPPAEPRPCIRADHHPWAPRPQYIGEHLNIPDIDAQSFVPMRTRGKKRSTGAFDEETSAFVHCRLRLLFVTDIYTPMRLDPLALKLAMKLRIPDPSGWQQPLSSNKRRAGYRGFQK